jgi:flagellar protein FliO/FliZ
VRAEPVREREPVRAEPVREREPARIREPEPPPPVAEPEFNANADQNLADMAQRLEAALRRPAKANEARSAETPARGPANDMNAAPPVPPRAAAAPPAEPSVGRGEPKPAKSLYDSLEKEMANLLGRPSGKS